MEAQLIKNIDLNFLLLLFQVCASGVMAWFTYNLWHATDVLAKETKVMASATFSPHVICYIEPMKDASNALHLVVHNVGSAPAYNVTVSIDPPIINPLGKSNKEYHINILPPNKKSLADTLDALNLTKDKNISYDFNVSIECSDDASGNKSFLSSYKISIDDLYKSAWKLKDAHDIANELEKIRKYIERISKTISIK